MIKCILNGYHTDINFYKGEHYMRAILMFKVTILYVISYQKNIIYDVTMFEDFKLFKYYWSELMNNKTNIPFKLIKNKKIF